MCLLNLAKNKAIKICERQKFTLMLLVKIEQGTISPFDRLSDIDSVKGGFFKSVRFDIQAIK